MYRFLIICMVSLLALVGKDALADELLIVTHPESSIGELSRQQASHIFLGRLRQLPSGERVTVIDVEPLRAAFYQHLVGRNLAEINAYWARLQFSGRTQPPLRVASAQEAIELVLDSRSAIAFVRADQLDPRARVVMRLGP